MIKTQENIIIRMTQNKYQNKKKINIYSYVNIDLGRT
jgi:hypothetical protein